MTCNPASPCSPATAWCSSCSLPLPSGRSSRPSRNREEKQMNEQENGSLDLIMPFTAIDGAMLPLAGGKAANLGELVRAGFPVPAGFCVSTAAYEMVAADAGLEPTLAALVAANTEDTERLAELATEARSCLQGASV